MNKSASPSAVPDDGLKSFVKSRVNGDRWEHILGVVSIAKKETEAYEELEEPPLETAAYLHDVAKNLPRERQRALAREYRGGFDPIEGEVPGLWHAPASAQVAVNEFSLDPTGELAQSIAFHPSGHSPMGPLLSGLMVADFCEPNRTFQASNQLRNRIGHDSLKTLARQVVKHKINHCLGNEQTVHPWSIEAYNDLCD